MNDVEIIDNFLDFSIFKNIQSQIYSPEMFWAYDKVVGDTDYNQPQQLCDELDNHQLSHVCYNNFVPNSACYEWFLPIVHSPKLNLKSLCRIKVNLNLRTPERVIHGYHTDFPFECKTAIFYINSNNGLTLFKNGQIIESVENRMVIFNSQLEHTGTTSTDTKNRIVVNFNYF